MDAFWMALSGVVKYSNAKVSLSFQCAPACIVTFLRAEAEAVLLGVVLGTQSVKCSYTL